MEAILRLARQSGILDLDRAGLDAFKSEGPQRVTDGEATLYRRSLCVDNSILYFIGAVNGEKSLYLLSEKSFGSGSRRGARAHRGHLHPEGPVQPGERRPSPCSLPFHRAGLSSQQEDDLRVRRPARAGHPGQLRAVAKYEVAPVLAQQSVRELTLTGRDFPGVIRDVTFLVFQEGWQTGYGADGDHLKSMTDIDAALNAGMPMITLDLTEVMSPGPASWSAGKVDAEFENLPDEVQARVTHTYADRTFQLAASTVHLSQTEARRCALMYLAALDFSQEVDRHLRARRGDDYDLEISIDETTAPTLPAHHLFFASELAFRGVTVSSLAPRFIGEFQKGIDYIGDVKEFERQLTVHCDIAKAFGGYKISVHSGSDKFSVYPSIGRQTGMRLHLKTAGTSWLQAVRVVARVNPALFRAMFAKSLASFPEATRLYHVAADPKAVPDAAGLSDSKLEQLLDHADSRQILHITYGGLLKDPQIRDSIFSCLAQNEELHYAVVEEHMEKHLRLLGAPPRG